MVFVEGIITHISLIHMQGVPKKLQLFPKKDEEEEELFAENGLSKDHQILTCQDIPENLLDDRLPHSVEIVCEDDLINQCMPNDKAIISGTYVCLLGEDGHICWRKKIEDNNNIALTMQKNCPKAEAH